MIRKSNPGSRIPAGELPTFKRWALPRVEGRHVVSSPFQEKRRQEQTAAEEESLDLSELTVEALQQLREEACREGRAEGLEAGRAQGIEEGQRLGQEAGHQAAYAEASAEIDDLKARLAALAHQLQQPLAEQHEALEQRLLELTVEIARAVVVGELATRPELLREAVQRALRVLPQDGPLQFTVHPDDEGLLQELREREGSNWEIRTDPALARGGLMVRGAHSYLDYSIDRRFAAVLQQLRQDRDDAAAVMDDDAPDQ